MLWAVENAQGGEILVPKIPSYRIVDLAEAIGPECKHPVVGIRPGEKIHEEMITEADSFNTLDLDRYFAILPTPDARKKQAYCEAMGATPVPQGFSYNSNTNPRFLTVDDLRHLIRRHVDSRFEA